VIFAGLQLVTVLTSNKCTMCALSVWSDAVGQKASLP
jgi:hypothetical protein